MKQLFLVVILHQLKAADIEVFTPNDKQYVKLSAYCITAAERSAFTFSVLAMNDAHVALMSRDNLSDPLYEIVIGGWGNSISCIRLGMQQPCKKTHTGQVLNGSTHTPFWVSWRNGTISLGQSDIVNNNMLIDYFHTTPFPVNFLSVMTGFGSTGQWKFINDVTCNEEVYDNTNVIVNNTTCNGISIYECVYGHFLAQGNLERTCLKGRRWSGEPPVCERCLCTCSMQNQQLFNSTEELEQRIEELVKFIKVEKNSTNAFMRRKISVRDFRPSSVRIGYICGYGIIVSLTSILVLSDVRILYRHLRFGAS